MSSESSEISTLTPSQEDDDTEKGNNSDEAEEEVEDQNVNAVNEEVNGLAETAEPVDPMVVEACMSPASPPAPQENEFDYEEEEDAIHLDHNDDMNYEEEGGNDDQEEEEGTSSFKPQNEEDYGNNASTPNDRFGELQGEDISAGESDEEDKGEICETNFEVENKMNAAKEEKMDAGSDEEEEEGEFENLEEGEIIDSDDGIPEIKGSMSPPEMADDFSKSFDTNNSAYDNTGNGGGGYPQQQHFDQQQQLQYEHREREQCRFYIRGNCRNGDACRFKHTFSTNARVQFQSKSNSARSSNYNIPVPPPTGPPIPLLSTEFAPPPSLALPSVRPSGPVNVDSAAWEQGLKKAREIVRRQQKTETKEEEEGKEERDEDRKSEDLSIGGKGFEKAELANAEAEEPISRHFHQQHRQQQYPSNVQAPHQNHHHRPIASRMVVEYVSVVTSPSVGGGSYGQRRSGNNDKSKVSIPSLIDNIIDKPMSPPPRERAPPMSLKTKQRDRDGRRTFESSNYSDPWARQNSSGGDYESGKRNGRTNSGRKRRRSSSAGSSSSSDGKPAKRRAHRTPSSPAHHHRQEDGRTNHHQHSTGQQSRHHNSSSRRVSNELPGRKETTSTERGEERKKTKEENDFGKAKLGRNDSASSRTSILSSKKRALGHGKAPSSRSSSVSSTTSTSTDSSREATLGSLLKTHPADKMTASQQSSSAKCKGPKTPPTPADLQRPSSESSTTASSSSHSQSQENRKKQSGNERPPSKHVDKSANIQSRQNSAKLDQQRRFSRGSNQSIKNDGKRRHSQQQQQVPRRSSMLKNEEDEEEEDAPAAYRISRKPSSNADSKRKRGGGGDRESSTSSLSSSSSSSSDSSSNSSALGRDGKRKPSAGDGKTMVTICSSERNMRIPVPSLDDKVDPISSDDDDGADERKNSLDGIAKQAVGRTNSDDNGEAKGVNANAADVESQSTSSSNVQKSSKEESSRKRKLELLQKLQSVEKAIARKKQQMDGGVEG